MKKLILFCCLCQLACQQTPAPPPPDGAKEKIVWDFDQSLNGAKDALAQLGPSAFEMSAGAETDFFIEPGLPPYEKNNAPLLLRTVDNTKPFTFSFKTTPVHTVKYDAGMAFLWANNKKWVKFAFEADERLKKRLVTVKTDGYSDDNNHDAIESPSVFLKISSDTKVIGFYYSIDGQTWQLVRVFKNDYPPTFQLGLGTQSPAGKGNKSLFEQLQFAETSVKDFRMGL